MAESAETKEIKTAEKKPVKHTKIKAERKHAKKKRHSHHKTLAMGDIVYTIPLRGVTRKPETFRTDYAMRLVRDFLRTHTKAEEIKLGHHLNEFVWSRGKKKFPRKVRVHVIRHEGSVKAELAGHEYVEFFAKKKEERSKGLMDKMKKRMTPKEEQKLKEEQLIEGKKPKEEKETAQTQEPADKTGKEKGSQPESEKQAATQ